MPAVRPKVRQGVSFLERKESQRQAAQGCNGHPPPGPMPESFLWLRTPPADSVGEERVPNTFSPDANARDADPAQVFECHLTWQCWFYGVLLFRQCLYVLVAIGPYCRSNAIGIQCFDHISTHRLFLIVQERVGFGLL